jgi:hypothetical protein
MVLISLQQKDRRADRKEGDSNLTIGFHIMKVEQNRKTIAHEQGKTIASSTYINSRSVFLRHRFPPGRYVIIPCTFSPGEDGEFLLRLYTDKKSDAMELVEHHPSKSWYQLCGPDYQCALRVKVVSAVGLEKLDTVGGADPYCAVKCEKGMFCGGEKARTQTVKVQATIRRIIEKTNNYQSIDCSVCRHPVGCHPQKSTPAAHRTWGSEGNFI